MPSQHSAGVLMNWCFDVLSQKAGFDCSLSLWVKEGNCAKKCFAVVLVLLAGKMGCQLLL